HVAPEVQRPGTRGHECGGCQGKSAALRVKIVFNLRLPRKSTGGPSCFGYAWHQDRSRQEKPGTPRPSSVPGSNNLQNRQSLEPCPSNHVRIDTPAFH